MDHSVDCVICGGLSNRIVYQGDIRDGMFGSLKLDATIFQCEQCGVQRLKESDCIPNDYYDSGEYRSKLEQSLLRNDVLQQHSKMNAFTYEVFPKGDLVGCDVIDVGCGSGSFLNELNSVAKSVAGIEPCLPYRISLNDSGYNIYPSIVDYLENNTHNNFDLAFSIQVIEHVENPKKFLEDISLLLKPGGEIIISTPNRNDIMMSLLYDEFATFFYRTQHRWYFDADSLCNIANYAGLEIVELKYVHRYGMSNTLHWLRDRLPCGDKRIETINFDADSCWKSYLENSGQSDNLYLRLKKPNFGQ